jgi:hypothetical protein
LVDIFYSSVITHNQYRFWPRTTSSTFCRRLRLAFFRRRNTPTNKSEVALLSHLIFFLYCCADERNYCTLVFMFVYRTNIPYGVPSRIWRSLLCSVTNISLKCTLTLTSMLVINGTSCHVSLFEFIRVEGRATFTEHLKGGASY